MADDKSAEAPTAAGSKFGCRAIAAMAATVGGVALLVVLSGRVTAAPEPAERQARPIVINGPKPLYARYKTGDVFQECAECPEMVVIVPDPKGFTIGSPESEQGRQSDEKQFGPVKFAKPYAIGKFEVTRARNSKPVAFGRAGAATGWMYPLGKCESTQRTIGSSPGSTKARIIRWCA